MAVSADALSNPILNGPYDIPSSHFEIGPHGVTGTILDGRRPSESYIPIAAPRKGEGFVEEMLELEGVVERREHNDLINDLRQQVGLWRTQNYPRATAISRKLLWHWADAGRENRVLFCQREAVETAIFLHEVAGREDFTDWRRRLADENTEYNNGLPRVALKMATGTGKTVVMAMLIAWQTLNKATRPSDSRFTKRFLVVTPGITIRDRLRVLQPGAAGNYYDERDLVPADMKGLIGQAQITISNYHAFLPRDAKEMRGVSKNTRKLLLAGRDDDPFAETEQTMVARVLRDLGSDRRSGEVMVFSDEAHHCYQDRPVGGLSAEEKAANADARVWFKGLEAIHRQIGIKVAYDLSATPYYLKGSGYHEGFIFPWTVSDFSLMDAIESGIVKVPRTPTDDDAKGPTVTYLDLWDQVGDELGKRRLAGETSDSWVIPAALEGALTTLYRHYEKSWRSWEQELEEHGEPPPVFIVVCPNTAASKLVYEWIAGREVSRPDADGGAGFAEHTTGALELFSNGLDGKMRDRPPTILVDSAQLESGEPLKGDFKSAVAGEIETFKAEYRRRNPGADVDKITDAELLREVMNTVGKKGRLGEQVRCVVSVAMLTEGWDANTVTHILGIRAFRSQLLCEQVVGRGLRRRSYALNDEGKFDPEYSNVFGIPFAFMPSDTEIGDSKPRPPATLVESLPGRADFRIEFPHVDGYRMEIPDEALLIDVDSAPRFRVGSDNVPRWTEVQDVVGGGERIEMATDGVREQRVAFEVAKEVLKRHFAVGADDRPWMFPRVLDATRQWLRGCVDVDDGYDIGRLLLAQARAEAAEQVNNVITRTQAGQRERVRPLLRRLDPVGSTADVGFMTRKATIETMKSEVSRVVLDGQGGNTWEQILAGECELSADVAAYVKNDHLGFTIPYLHQGRSHQYLPDFLLRLRPRDPDDVVRTLIVEVSGGQKSPGPTAQKATTARDLWCVAVNNHGGFGRWGYVEITTMLDVRDRLRDAIESLYADEHVTGDPDLIDYPETHADEVPRGA